MRISLSKLLKRTKNLRLSRGREGVVREPHFFAYGLKQLYLSFDRI